MGKKKAKVEPVKVIEPPFSFHIDNFPENTGQCALHLYDTIDVNFKEIEIEVKVSRHPETSKPMFDLVIVKSKEQPRPRGMYMGEELLPFPVYVLETKQTLRVEPLRTGGQQPFIMVDPETGTERTIDSPYFIHYQLSNRKRYILDLRKFAGGKLKFKDPETGEDILVDVTQRVDPLSGLPLYGEKKNPDRVFLDTIKDGQVYVVKDPETDDIQVLRGNGQPALEYRTYYDLETDTTSLLDDQGEVVLVLGGNHPIQLNIPEDVLKEIEPAYNGRDGNSDQENGMVRQREPKEDESIDGVEKAKMHLGFESDRMISDDDQGYPLDINNEPSGEYEKMKHLLTRSKNNGVTFVDEDGKPIDKEIAGPSSDLKETTAVNETSKAQPSEKFHIEINSTNGAIQMVDTEGRVIDIPEGSRIEKDPVNGISRLVDESGAPLNIREIMGLGVTDDQIPADPNSDKRLGISQGVNVPQHEGREMPGVQKQLMGSNKLSLLGNRDQENSKMDEEKYFERLKVEDGWAILEDVNDLDEIPKKLLLQGLIQAIEFEKDFVNCAIDTKLEMERMFIAEIMNQKKSRQKQYIADLVQKFANTYDRHELEREVMDKLERENEYIFDKLNAKIAKENDLVNQAMQHELKTNRKIIVDKTNNNCYERCKRIVMKYLAEKLQEEIIKVKKELCLQLHKERITITRSITEEQTAYP